MGDRQNDKKTNTPQFLSREGKNEILYNFEVQTRADDDKETLITNNHNVGSLNIDTKPQIPPTINLAHLNKIGSDIDLQNVSDQTNLAKVDSYESFQNGSINNSTYWNSRKHNTPPLFNTSQYPTQTTTPPPHIPTIPPTPPTPTTPTTPTIPTDYSAPNQTKIIYKEKRRGCLGRVIGFVLNSIGCLLFVVGLLILLFVYVINF